MFTVSGVPLAVTARPVLVTCPISLLLIDNDTVVDALRRVKVVLARSAKLSSPGVTDVDQMPPAADERLPIIKPEFAPAPVPTCKPVNAPAAALALIVPVTARPAPTVAAPLALTVVNEPAAAVVAPTVPFNAPLIVVVAEIAPTTSKFVPSNVSAEPEVKTLEPLR